MKEKKRVPFGGFALALLCSWMLAPFRLGASPPQSASDEAARFHPLFALEVKQETLGWSGIELGMSLVQVERRVGTALALSEEASAACGRWRTQFDRLVRVTIGLDAAKPSAKVVWLRVRFEGYQVASELQDLVRDLKERIPDVRNRAGSESGENDPTQNPAAVFEVERGRNRFVIELVPREGMTIWMEPCRPAA